MQQYNDVIFARNSSGSAVVPLAGASISVFNQGTRVLATIYSDNGTTLKDNPFDSTTDGRVAFYAADGRYDIEASKRGYDTIPITDVLLEDPEDIGPTEAALIGLTPKTAGEWTESLGTVQERLSHEFYVSDRIPGTGRVGRANPNRDATWNNAAWADAVDYAVEEGKTLRWTGIYQLTEPLVMDMGGKASFDVDRPSILGHGPGQSAIYYSGAADSYCLTVTGPDWDATYTPYTNAQTFGNFLIRCRNPLISDSANVCTRNAIKWERGIGVHWETINILEAKLGVELIDVVHLSNAGVLDIGFSAYGLKATRSTHLGVDNYGSPVNEVRLRVKIHSSRQWGIDLYDINNWGLTGSIENTARPGVWSAETDQFGLRVNDGGYNGPQILELSGGFHFESSGGDADLIINHTSRPGAYRIAADFVRNGSSVYVPNNIVFNTTGATRAIVDLSGSSFSSVNGYTPSSSRRYVTENVSGGSAWLHQFIDHATLYESDTERPAFLRSGHRQESHPHAWVLFTAAGTVSNAFNTTGPVTKNATGDFTWTLSTPNLTSTYPVFMGASLVALTMEIVSRSTTAIQVRFRNTAGTLTDPSSEVSLIAMYG